MQCVKCNGTMNYSIEISHETWDGGRVDKIITETFMCPQCGHTITIVTKEENI